MRGRAEFDLEVSLEGAEEQAQFPEQIVTIRSNIANSKDNQ